jgi:hypothetical protein
MPFVPAMDWRWLVAAGLFRALARAYVRPMRAEAESLKADIEQAVGLLRRFL